VQTERAMGEISGGWKCEHECAPLLAALHSTTEQVPIDGMSVWAFGRLSVGGGIADSLVEM